MYTGFWWENLREREHLEDPDIAASAGSGMGGMDWIDLAQEVGTCKCNNEP